MFIDRFFTVTVLCRSLKIQVTQEKGMALAIFQTIQMFFGQSHHRTLDFTLCSNDASFNWALHGVIPYQYLFKIIIDIIYRKP